MQRGIAVAIVFAMGLPALSLPNSVFSVAQGAVAGNRRVVAVALGLLAGAGIYRVLVTPFWRVLHHELAHAVVAVAVGVRPATLHASAAGGMVHFAQGRAIGWAREFAIAIAPYSVSPVALAVACMALPAPDPGPLAVAACAGCAGAALVAPLLEIHTGQVDLQRYGFWPPAAAAVWLWGGSAALVITALVHASPQALGLAYVRGGNRLVHLVETCVDYASAAGAALWFR